MWVGEGRNWKEEPGEKEEGGKGGGSHSLFPLSQKLNPRSVATPLRKNSWIEVRTFLATAQEITLPKWPPGPFSGS